MQLQVIDPKANFACSSCGWCCDQPWATVLAPADAERYDKIDWGSEFPQLKGKKLYRKVKRNGKVSLELTKSSGNRCIFLDDDNRCIVHSKLGLEAKPHMCKQFPYLPVNANGEQRVSVNYGCKAVQHAKGPALAAQQSDIDAVITPPTKPGTAPAKMKFTLDVDVPREAGKQLINHLASLFDPADPTNVAQCFAWCLDLLEFAGNCEPEDLCSRLNSATSLPVRRESEWQCDAKPALAPMPARMLFAATLYPDLADPNDTGLLKRFALIPKLLSVTQLKGGYASRILARNINIGSLFANDATPTLDADANALLKKYIQARLWQQLPTGTRLPIVSGIHQHILDLAAIVMYAQLEDESARASSNATNTEQAQQSLSFDAISRGLNIVEFHLANQERLADKVLQAWFSGALASLPVANASLGLVRLATTKAAAS